MRILVAKRSRVSNFLPRCQLSIDSIWTENSSEREKEKKKRTNAPLNERTNGCTMAGAFDRLAHCTYAIDFASKPRECRVPFDEYQRIRVAHGTIAPRESRCVEKFINARAVFRSESRISRRTKLSRVTAYDYIMYNKSVVKQIVDFDVSVRNLKLET